MIKASSSSTICRVVRLAKFYEQVHVTGESAEQAQQSVIKKIYRAVSKRQDNQCNYWREHPGVGRRHETYI